MNRLRRINPESKTFRLGAALLALVAVAWALFTSNGMRYRLDTDVYRIGAQRLLDGQELYSGSFHISDDIFLPFTYPPFAALSFIPLTIFTAHGASLAFGVVSIAALAAVVWILLRQVGRISVPNARWVAVGLVGLLIFFGPVSSTLSYGQVNLILALLILADVTIIPPKYRGLLTGLATAFKLTPAVFGLWFLLRKDIPSIIRMGVATLVATGLGFLFLPDASSTYWFGTLQKTDRIGGLGYSSNQSFNGELWRLGLRTADSGSVWWLLLVILVLAATIALMVRLFRRNLPVLALCVNGFFGLLASPVSWDHHFVWVAIFIVLLGIYWFVPKSRPGEGVEKKENTWTPAQLKIIATTAVAGLICCAVSPRSVAPSGSSAEQHWNVLWHVLGNAYMWWMIAAFIALWLLTAPKHYKQDQHSA